jgi:pilus assembly protein Flp/PilA
MNPSFLCSLRNLHNDECGQDLIEYALVACLIALGAITGMQSVSSGLNTAFSSVTSMLASAV